MMFLSIFLSAIQLVGVTGKELRARAFFDVNNVKVGDPLVLTVDFIGEADFSNLHPPALSKAVNRRDWKLDDISAKTSTWRDARRLTYRVRPMREGVLWFPALDFEYDGKTVRSNPIPVHAKPGSQVVVAEMGEVEENGFPKPPELIRKFGGEGADDEFRWRKALAHPKAEAFAAFGFPAARMNEATCAIREGNWARALSAYRRVEWRIGQTPEVERGIVAALALRYDNPSAELPVWRSVLRPLLKHDWKGRVLIVFGALAALALLLKLLSLGIRALACAGLAVFFAGAAFAETVETVTTNADGSVTRRKVIRGGSGGSSFTITTSSSSGGAGAGRMPSFGGFGRDPFSMFDDDDFPFGGRRRQQRLPPVRIAVGMRPDKAEVTVGETFNLVLTVERPRYVSFSEGVGLSLVEQDVVKQAAPAYALRQAPSSNPTNILDRLVFPMRALAPVKGPLRYSVSGNYVYADRRGGFMPSFFQQAHPYRSGPRTCPFVAREPPAEGRPAGYSGIVAEGLSVVELPDMLRVGTNDVVTITYRLRAKGFVPKDFLPKDAAFEWARDDSGETVEYRRYFVAGGAAATPVLEIPYYDSRTRRYRTARCGGTAIVYVPSF